MIHQVVIYPHKSLLTPAKPVEKFDEELHSLLEDLYETMYSQNGIGLAAPQVNISKRILVMDISEERNQPQALINPEIVCASQDLEKDKEGCLSFPGLYIDIERPNAVTIKAKNEKGELVEISATGLNARCIQHEMDHLDGIVFIDRLSRIKKDRALKKFKKLMRN